MDAAVRVCGAGEGVDHVRADEGVVHVASDRDGREQPVCIPCAEAVAHGVDEDVGGEACEGFVRDEDGAEGLKEEREAWVGGGDYPGAFLQV